MAYQINKYNNELLTVVEDGTIDSASTSLKFIGKNYAGYGEIQNENFLYLLENFAGANMPVSPITGQVWFDTATSKLKFYDGNQWRTTGGSEVGASQPVGLSSGDFWWNNDDRQLFVYDGNDFVLIGPQAAGDGVTQMISLEVRADDNSLKGVIAATVEDEVVLIISPYDNFKLSSINPIDGFDIIGKGTTLKNAYLDPNFDIEIGQNGSNTFRYWGTASNSLKLEGLEANDFIRKDNAIFDAIATFPQGIVIGDDLVLKIYQENATTGVIENQVSTNSIIKLNTTDNVGNATNITAISLDGVLPGQNNVFDLGSNTNRWNTVFATEFNGTATRANSLALGATTYLSASVAATPDTIVARDSSGNLAANLFQGVATAARYADLAEKYTTEGDLPVGTAVSVCVHTDHEVCSAQPRDICIGVVSDKPAYLMNSESDGQAIALKGRVPVRIKGPVRKGDAIYVWNNGICSTTRTEGFVGIALETNNSEGEKLVECVLKV